MKLFLFFMLFLLILLYPSMSVRFAATGLNLWFECMVPALLPFMILSGIMIRQNLTERFAKVLSPVLRPIYRLNNNCVYCIILGFFCGFPMGAKTVAELYERKQLSKKEASLLLSFCNNIGPVYFLNFLLPTIGMNRPLQTFLCLFGMYGIPLCYGLFLRYSSFCLPAGSFPRNENRVSSPTEPFFKSLDDAMQSGIAGITTLGGYMIFFNLLNLVPHILLPLLKPVYNEKMLLFSHCLMEITSGVSYCGMRMPFMVLVLLPIGGLSCIAQTASMIKNTDLSLGRYLVHKLVQTLLTYFYYYFLRFLLF
ncbi:MAG: hypothetical protein J1E83_04080 [Lachnospiraceae bacterium]|nr:hypothetical protein [Lachnospiraceae bacterium]